MSYRERSGLGLITALIVLTLGAGLAFAQTPQTIVIDGVNDFLPGFSTEADWDETARVLTDQYAPANLLSNQ